MPDRNIVMESLNRCSSNGLCNSCWYWNHIHEGDCYDALQNDALKLLEEDEQNLPKPATYSPEPSELLYETKRWLDNMTAEERLQEISVICIDWDGYRTAEGLGSLINEIWAYARYPVKKDNPHIVTINDFKNADEWGYLPVWCEEKITDKLYCNCIPQVLGTKFRPQVPLYI